MGVVITDFSKIKMRKKVLYVRLKGIPEGGLKALVNKGFLVRVQIGILNRPLLLHRCFSINCFHVRTFGTVVMNPDINVVK